MFYRHPSADMLFTPGRGGHRGDRSRPGAPLRFDQPRQRATRGPASLFAADQARAAGHLVTYDVNLRLPLWPDADAARAGILTGLAKAQVAKLSDDELEFMTGSREPGGRAPTSGTTACGCVTLSRGSAGSTWFTADAQNDVPTLKVAAVDTTGAGDGFMAGLIAGLLAEPDALGDPTRLDRICRFANAVGALTTLERGAIPALPSRAAVEQFLERYR